VPDLERVAGFLLAGAGGPDPDSRPAGSSRAFV